jgi:hypothetical protein
MAWLGYFTMNGSEFINMERTEKYLADAKVSWFIPRYGENGITAAVSDAPYEGVEDDPAPWVDPDIPVSTLFWGTYPLSVVGLSDSSRAAVITENIGNGGSIGPVRAASKQVVFEVILLGANEAATEYGLNWLKSLLTGVPCDSGAGCDEGELCYLASKPCAGLPCHGTSLVLDDTCRVETIYRTLRGVKSISGPTITSQRSMSDGSSMVVVTFTIAAGDPFEYGMEVELVEGFGVEADPWVPDVVPADWAFDDTGVEIDEIPCALAVYQPIVDPLCPAIEPPPVPPSIPVGCFVVPEQWERRWFTLPRKYVPYWGDSVPVVSVQATVNEVRGLRLRFYSDPYADVTAMEDSCAFCGDILFSYIPPSTTMILDGISQQVIAEGAGGERQRADSLVFATDGSPFEWPLLSCGFGYVVAVDVPADQAPGWQFPAIDLTLVPRSAI